MDNANTQEHKSQSSDSVEACDSIWLAPVSPALSCSHLILSNYRSLRKVGLGLTVEILYRFHKNLLERICFLCSY